MSISFSPTIDYKNLDENKLNWTAQYIQHCSWSNLPEQFKKLSQEPYVDGDIGYFLWEEGEKSLSTWQNWLKKYNMILFEDYPFKKIYVDNEKYKVAIVLYGEPKEHKGMEMTLANENARVLCQLLGIPESGSSHPLALLKKIEQIKNKNITEFTRPETDEQFNDPDAPLGLGKGSRMIDFGLSKEKIMNYLIHLENLCDHCIKYECNINWG